MNLLARMSMVIFPALALLLTRVSGATVEVVPAFGYQFTGGEDLAGPQFDRLDFKNHALRGLSIGYLTREEGQIELAWTRSQTGAVVDLTGGAPADRFDVRIDRVHFNFMYVPDKKSVQPFFLIGLGGTRFTPETDRRSVTRFSLAVGGGMKWLWNDHIGLRFDGRWTPVFSPRGSHYFCSADGSKECYATEQNSFIGQYPFLNGFEFLSGLIFRY